MGHSAWWSRIGAAPQAMESDNSQTTTEQDNVSTVPQTPPPNHLESSCLPAKPSKNDKDKAFTQDYIPFDDVSPLTNASKTALGSNQSKGADLESPIEEQRELTAKSSPDSMKAYCSSEAMDESDPDEGEIREEDEIEGPRLAAWQREQEVSTAKQRESPQVPVATMYPTVLTPERELASEMHKLILTSVQYRDDKFLTKLRWVYTLLFMQHTDSAQPADTHASDRLFYLSLLGIADFVQGLQHEPGSQALSAKLHRIRSLLGFSADLSVSNDELRSGIGRAFSVRLLQRMQSYGQEQFTRVQEARSCRRRQRCLFAAGGAAPNGDASMYPEHPLFEEILEMCDLQRSAELVDDGVDPPNSLEWRYLDAAEPFGSWEVKWLQAGSAEEKQQIIRERDAEIAELLRARALRHERAEARRPGGRRLLASPDRTVPLPPQVQDEFRTRVIQAAYDRIQQQEQTLGGQDAHYDAPDSNAQEASSRHVQAITRQKQPATKKTTATTAATPRAKIGAGVKKSKPKAKPAAATSTANAFKPGGTRKAAAAAAAAIANATSTIHPSTSTDATTTASTGAGAGAAQSKTTKKRKATSTAVDESYRQAKRAKGESDPDEDSSEESAPLRELTGPAGATRSRIKKIRSMRPPTPTAESIPPAEPAPPILPITATVDELAGPTAPAPAPCPPDWSRIS